MKNLSSTSNIQPNLSSVKVSNIIGLINYRANVTQQSTNHDKKVDYSELRVEIPINEHADLEIIKDDAPVYKSNNNLSPRSLIVATWSVTPLSESDIVDERKSCFTFGMSKARR